MSERVYVGAGGNISDGWGTREEYLERAAKRLEMLPGVDAIRSSRVIETPPWGKADQGMFLNQVHELDTRLEPRELLSWLIEIETAFGRKRAEKNGPRTIDLDIVLFGDRVIDEPGLTVPHPRMHERRFVLEPLAEIAPGAVHPVLKKTAREMLEALP